MKKISLHILFSLVFYCNFLVAQNLPYTDLHSSWDTTNKEAANKNGYWYFINAVQLPEKAMAGQKVTIKIIWLNKGAAAANHRSKLLLMFKSKRIEAVQSPASSDNRKWLPDSLVEETYTAILPSTLEEGITQVTVKLINEKPAVENIKLGMRWKTTSGFYKIGKINIVSKQKSKKKKIVFFGDSITEGAFEKDGYADMLLRKYPQFSKYSLIGAGIGGNRVINLTKRVDKDVLIYHPSKVVVYVGVNDCGWHRWHPDEEQFTVTQYEEILLALVKKLLANKIEVVLCTPMLIGEKQQGENYLDAELDLYVSASERVAATSRCSFINLRKLAFDYLKKHNPQNLDRGILTEDGVHTIAAGSALTAGALSKAIKLN